MLFRSFREGRPRTSSLASPPFPLATTPPLLYRRHLKRTNPTMDLDPADRHAREESGFADDASTVADEDERQVLPLPRKSLTEIEDDGAEEEDANRGGEVDDAADEEDEEDEDEEEEVSSSYPNKGAGADSCLR